MPSKKTQIHINTQASHTLFCKAAPGVYKCHFECYSVKPCSQVTSACAFDAKNGFNGNNLQRLHLTSVLHQMSRQEWGQNPFSASAFVSPLMTLNFDGKFDSNADVTCEHGFKCYKCH